MTTARRRSASIVPTERIERAIVQIRTQQVMLDADLADLYGVETRQLTRAVRRNLDRFPADFMFQLTNAEFENLRSHSGTSSQWGGRRYRPYAFTEQGVPMLSSVLRNDRAVQVNIEIMRAFVRFRHMITDHSVLLRKVNAMERKYDKRFKVVFDALRLLIDRPEPRKKPIGFHTE